jgi:hypothetical protein
MTHGPLLQMIEGGITCVLPVSAPTTATNNLHHCTSPKGVRRQANAASRFFAKNGLSTARSEIMQNLPRHEDIMGCIQTVVFLSVELNYEEFDCVSVLVSGIGLRVLDEFSLELARMTLVPISSIASNKSTPI